jgi:hypothetical protein
MADTITMVSMTDRDQQPAFSTSSGRLDRDIASMVDLDQPTPFSTRSNQLSKHQIPIADTMTNNSTALAPI